MRIPSVDYQPLFTATSAKYGAKQAAISAEQAKLTPQSLALQQKSLDLSKTDLAVKTALGAAQLGLQAVQVYSDIKQTADLEASKNNILTTGTEYGELALEAILNNTTTVSYENGIADVKIAPELQSYKETKLAEIESSNKSKTVKSYEKQQLMSLFASEDDAVMKNAATKHLNDINTSFEMNHSISLQSDIKAGEGYSAGQALIASRRDLSPAQRESAFYAYQKEVDFGRADAQTTTLAKAEGVGKAIEYAYSLEGFSQAQVQSMVSNASKASQSLTAAAQTTAQNTMRSGLESGAVPSTLYQQIEQATADMPTERKNAALDIARATHIEWATSTTAENWSADQSLSYDQFKTQRESIAKGERSYIYNGIADTKTATLAMYDKALSAMEESGTKAFSQATTDNINAIVATAQLGAISGLEAVTQLSKFTKDNPVATVKAINQIVSEAIPETLKPFVEDFTKNTLPAIMQDKFKAKTEGDLSAEQRNAITSAQMFAAGQFVDLALQSKDMNVSQFTEAMNNITRIYTSKEMDAISTGKVMEDTSGTFNNAMKMLDTFATVDPVVIDFKGNTTWATPAMEATFDQASLALGVELDKRGISVESYMPMPIFDDSGNAVDAIAKPVFKSGETFYAFEKDKLMVSQDLISWKYAPSKAQEPAPAPKQVAQTLLPQASPQQAQAGSQGLRALPPQSPRSIPTVTSEADDISGPAPTVAKATQAQADEVASIMSSGIDLTKREVVAQAVMESALPVENMTEAQVVADAIVIAKGKGQPTIAVNDGEGQRVPSPKERDISALQPGTQQGTRADIKSQATSQPVSQPTAKDQRPTVSSEQVQQAEQAIEQAVETLGQKRVDELVQMVSEPTAFDIQKLNWKPIDIEAMQKSDQTFINVVQSNKRPTQGRKD